MKNNLLRDFSVDRENKRIRIERELAAPLSKAWAAWTESSLLDQWWGPKPWRAETKEMDFRAGGHWLYAMVGPSGERHWSRADYESVVSLRSFSFKSFFCDEHGAVNEAR